MPGFYQLDDLTVTRPQRCGLRLSVLGQDQSETKNIDLDLGLGLGLALAYCGLGLVLVLHTVVLVLQVWCCVVKHGLVLCSCFMLVE